MTMRLLGVAMGGRSFAILAILIISLPAAWAVTPEGATILAPRVGPDMPTATEPVAMVSVWEHDRWAFTEGTRHATMVVPDDASWQRVFVELTIEAGKDPWDRLFGVSVDGVEVIRGTTPRADMTLRKEVTSYAALLTPGETVDVGMYLGTWVGDMFTSVSFSFYDEAVPTGVETHDAVFGAFAFGRLNHDGDVLSRGLDFPTATPSAATVELTLTGHGGEEFWYLDSPVPRSFSVRVDGVEVARATAMPYVYALIGFGGNGAVVWDAAHEALWWGAPRAADEAGVHGGIGEIPPYRGSLDASMLPLLQGARHVEVVQEGGATVWVTGLTFLVDA